MNRLRLKSRPERHSGPACFVVAVAIDSRYIVGDPSGNEKPGIFMRKELSALIVERLRRDTSALRAAFARPAGVQTRFAVVDDVLPSEIAGKIYAAFPQVSEMRLLSSFRERKYTSKSLETMDPLIAEATFAFQSPEVIAEVTSITRIRDMVGDPQLYAGGISAMTKGHFLNPHIDNSHDGARRYYRTLNLLYYVTPDWRPEYGGNLELWDQDVKQRVTVPSLFNRLVVMETTPRSWHSVSPVAHEGTRCCVSNYYFSDNSPEGYPYSHVTSFSARPEQPLRRGLARVDGALRNALRHVFRKGLGKTDVYTPKS